MNRWTYTIDSNIPTVTITAPDGRTAYLAAEGNDESAALAASALTA